MLDALGEAGSGWYRQVALAVKMEAHKALGMDRRDFTARIGIRMGGTTADRDNAIRELSAEGVSNTAIADVLRVSAVTVRNVLEGRDGSLRGEEITAGTKKSKDEIGDPDSPKKNEIGDPDLRDEQILALQEELRSSPARA